MEKGNQDGGQLSRLKTGRYSALDMSMMNMTMLLQNGVPAVTYLRF